MVSLPPPAIASRALSTRLRIALSSCPASTCVHQRPALSTVSIAMPSGRVRFSISVRPATSLLASSGLGSSAWRRAKASRRRVRLLARSAPRTMAYRDPLERGEPVVNVPRELRHARLLLGIVGGQLLQLLEERWHLVYRGSIC